MANKKDSEKSRACSICSKSGHNSRTCPVKKANEAAAGGSVMTQQQAQPSAAMVPVSLVSSGDSHSQGGESAPVVNRHEPISFQEQVIQEHVNGTTFRLTLRDYPNGVSTLGLRTMNDATSPKDMQFDIEGASKLYQMFGSMLQRVAAGKSQRQLPVARSTNGLSGHSESATR